MFLLAKEFMRPHDVASVQAGANETARLPLAEPGVNW